MYVWVSAVYVLRTRVWRYVIRSFTLTCHGPAIAMGQPVRHERVGVHVKLSTQTFVPPSVYIRQAIIL